MKTSLIAPFFATLKAANPLPNTELEYTSVFELLTAVLLSAQATDVSVNKATRRLFVVAHTPQAMLDLGQEGLESHIKTIGLFRSKAKHLLATCRILVEQHASAVPRTRAELEACPAWAAKPPTWYSTSPLASRRWRWIRTSFASATAPAWHPAKRHWR